VRREGDPCLKGVANPQAHQWTDSGRQVGGQRIGVRPETTTIEMLKEQKTKRRSIEGEKKEQVPRSILAFKKGGSAVLEDLADAKKLQRPFLKKNGK